MKKSYIKLFNCVVVICFCFFLSLNNVNAEEINIYNDGKIVDETDNTNEGDTGNTENISGVLDSKLQEGVYKYSENKVPYLPFVRYATDRILIDKEIGGTGVSMSAKSIEVSAKTSGIQVLFANDATRINAPMEYAIIFGGNSVTIDSTIEKAVLIYGGSEVTIGENAKINGDLICYATSVNVKGEVSGSIIGAANNLSITGKIGRDLRMQVNEISIESEDTIAGYTYLETYNSDLKLDEKYDAKIEYLKTRETGITFKTVIDGIVASLLFALVYLIIIRKNDGKMLDTMLNKTKENSLFVILSSVIFLVLLPILVMILVILALVGLSAIAVPLLIAIISIFIIECLLSTFIVGSVMARYMDLNYFIKKGLSASILGTFIIYLTLYLLARVPVISGYVVIGLIVLSTGITLSCIFRRSKTISN